MTNRKAGRPVGTSPHKEDDAILLYKAAHMLIRLQVKTPTAAFRKLLAEDDEGGIRRLQRKWKVQSEELIQAARKPFMDEMWERDEQNFKHDSPDAYLLVNAFAQSEGGKAYLRERGTKDKPIHIMSVGLAMLSELLKTTTMHGGKKAEEEFSKLYLQWNNFGSQPDTEFLRTFGKLCIEKADQLQAEKAESEEGGKL